MYAYATYGTPVRLRDIGQVIALPFLISGLAGSSTWAVDLYLLKDLGHVIPILISFTVFIVLYILMFLYYILQNALK